MTSWPDEDAARELVLLTAAWDEARQRWHDNAAVRFEDGHWAPLYQASREYLDALGALLELIEAADRETA